MMRTESRGMQNLRDQQNDEGFCPEPDQGKTHDRQKKTCQQNYLDSEALHDWRLIDEENDFSGCADRPHDTDCDAAVTEHGQVKRIKRIQGRVRRQHKTAGNHECDYFTLAHDLPDRYHFFGDKRLRRLVKAQADDENGSEDRSPNPGHQANPCPVQHKTGSRRHEDIADRSPQTQLSVTGHIALHFREDQGVGQGALCAGKEIQGNHEESEVPEAATEKETGKRDQRRACRELEHPCTLPCPVRHPSPQIRPDNTHGLHQRHQDTDFKRTDAPECEIKGNEGRKNADETVIAEIERAETERLFRP